MISSSMTANLVSNSEGHLDIRLLFGQPFKCCIHAIMGYPSHNWDLQLKIAELVKGGILGHFRAFQEKKIGIGPQGYSFGTITRGPVVLEKYVKCFSMPTLTLIPQNWGLKNRAKNIFGAGKTNLPHDISFAF